MALPLIIGIITAMVVTVTYFLEYFCSILKILFKRPLPPKGAVEIDPIEHIYAHPDYTKHLQDASQLDVHTVYEVLLHGLQVSPNRPQFAYRYSSDKSFEYYTYKEVFEILQEIGSGICYTGLPANNQTYIGIYSSTTVNYALCLYATWPYSMVPIGIYDSLGRDGVKFIIRHADVELVFADDLKRVKNLIEWKDDTLALKTIVSFAEVTDELVEAAQQKNLMLMTIDKLRENGRNNLQDVVPPKPSDTAVIMYTSGSTGEPKGCVITHANFICSIFGVASALDMIDYDQPHRVLNYMPLAHMFGCGTIVALTYLGGTIGFWQGKVDKLLDDFRDFKPTILTMVPRLLNRLYDRARTEARKKGVVGRVLFRLAIISKLALIRRGDFSQNTIWDKLIFQKVRQSFGGEVKRVVSSSAPLSREVCRFSRAAFSCFFVESYGQTECVLGCSQTIHDIESGETGVPTSMNYMKLVDVPEKEYYAKDGVGEICLKSPAMFKGYLKDEEKTREAIDEDGWLHTGDIGRWTPHKTMTIVDRKKNMYKLSQGEYVAPEKIEDVYARSRFISQIFVYGDSLESSLVAIVVLDEEFVKKWASGEGLVVDSDGLPQDTDALKKVIVDDINHEGKKRGLMPYEQVKGIEIIKEAFTIENGLLTPTFKSRRYAVEKKYKDVFQSIYKRINAGN